MPAKLKHSCLFAQQSCLVNLVLVDLVFQICGILVAIQKETEVPLAPNSSLPLTGLLEYIWLLTLLFLFHYHSLLRVADNT